MRHIGLKVRMAVVGALLAAFYLVASAAASISAARYSIFL